MNREQRRKANKILKTVDGHEQFETMIKNIEVLGKASKLKDGDFVKINAEQMMQRKEWKRLNPKYREFITQNRDTIFTAKIRRRSAAGYPVIIDLNENDTWSFWVGDLIILENNTEVIT